MIRLKWANANTTAILGWLALAPLIWTLGCAEGKRDPNESLIPTLPAATKPTGTVEERVKLAEELGASEKYEEALKPLEEAMMIDAKDRKVLLRLSQYGLARARAIVKTDPAEAYKQIVSTGEYLRMLRRDFPEATPEEKQLALEVLYAEASAHAKSLRMEETLGALRQAAGEGFDDFERIRNDPDWKELLDLPEFKKEFDEIANPMQTP